MFIMALRLGDTVANHYIGVDAHYGSSSNILKIQPVEKRVG